MGKLSLVSKNIIPNWVKFNHRCCCSLSVALSIPIIIYFHAKFILYQLGKYLILYVVGLESAAALRHCLLQQQQSAAVPTAAEQHASSRQSSTAAAIPSQQQQQHLRPLRYDHVKCRAGPIVSIFPVCVPGPTPLLSNTCFGQNSLPYEQTTRLMRH